VILIFSCKDTYYALKDQLFRLHIIHMYQNIGGGVMYCISVIYKIFYTFYTLNTFCVYKYKNPQIAIFLFAIKWQFGEPCALLFLCYFKDNRFASSVFAPGFPNIFLLIVDFMFVIR